jgi:hypothetical protein
MAATAAPGEYPVEQYYRDARLNPIHEGTNGVQALDLLGRKVAMEDGAAFALLVREMGRTVDAALEAGLLEYADALSRAIDRATATTKALLAARGNIALALANASVYLDMLGHTVVAWMWLRQALAAMEGARVALGAERDFHDGELAACRDFFRWELPKTEAQAALVAVAVGIVDELEVVEVDRDEHARPSGKRRPRKADLQ